MKKRYLLAAFLGLSVVGHAMSALEPKESKPVAQVQQEAPAPGSAGIPANPNKMTTAERAVCVRQLKNQLRDPGSLKRLTGPFEENRTGIIKYSAKNGFGGRTVAYFDCLSGKNYQV